MAYQRVLPYSQYKLPFKVPSGLITWFNTTSVPTGWSRVTAADARYPVGAGSTYSYGSTGGTDITGNCTTNNEGTHGANDVDIHIPYTGGSGWAAVTFSAELHQHVQIQLLGRAIRYRRVLISANSEMDFLPADAIVMTHTNDNPSSDTSSVATGNYHVESNNYVDTPAASWSLNNCDTISSHIHYSQGWGLYYWGMGGGGYDQGLGGNHTHTLTSASVSVTLKARYLRAWKGSSEFRVKENMICMYNSATPPDGWALCDGNNGTPDMRDYFVIFCSSGNTNSTQGASNTVNPSGTVMASAGSHHHLGTYRTNYYQTQLYHNTAGAHTHTLPSQSKSYAPKYFGIYYIMKLGR